MLASIHLLLDAVPPPLRGSQFGATEIDAVPNVMIAVVAALYVWGVARNNRLHPRHRWSPWRTASFLGGLVVTAVAVESFIGYYDGALFWDHMVQHLLLVMIAAPMFAVGSPLALAFRASTGTTHQLVVRGLRSPVAKFFGNPLVGFVGYALVIPITHLTSFYNLTLQNEIVHDQEHLLFLVFGYLFWRQVFGIEPNRYRLHPALQMGYLFLAVPVDTFTGLSLNSTSHEIFPAYTAMHRTWGPSLVTDLHLGGVIMWVGGDTLMLLAMIPVAVKWMRLEERRTALVDRELDRVMPAGPSTAVGPDGGAAPVPAGATPGHHGGWRSFLPPSQAE